MGRKSWGCQFLLGSFSRPMSCGATGAGVGKKMTSVFRSGVSGVSPGELSERG